MSLSASEIALLKSHTRPLTATVIRPSTWEDGTPMDRGPGCIESLADGVRDELPPLIPNEIIKGCGFFREAWRTGGRDYNQPQWMFTTLAATWFESGKDFAHAFAKGHEGYTPESTDAMWERKLRDRAASDKLGWPSCRTIEQTGCVACGTCPHRAKNLSPLNLAEGKIVARPNPAPQGTTFVPTASVSVFVDLPPGYEYVNDVIHVLVPSSDKKEKNAPSEERLDQVPLFKCVIKNAWLEKGYPNLLHFEFSADIKNAGGRHWRQTAFSWGDLGKPEKVFSTLLDAGVIPNPDLKSELLKRFFVSWLDKMQNSAEANETVSFGWFNDIEGFAFDKVLYLKDGEERPSGVLEDLVGRFTKRGDDTLVDWINAFETVRTLSCPANMIAVAASFASPLLRFAGEKGAVLSLHGRSAAGKTSASKLGMAVWGDPGACGGRSDASLNSLPDTFGALQNLPFFWDDPQLNDMPKVRTTSFTATNGTTKMRSMVKRDGTVGLAPVKKFTLINILLTNHSIFDGVNNADRNGDAGPARAFEVVVPDIRSDPHAMDKGRAADLLEKLDNHYGQMGHLFAKHIAMNVAAIDARVKEWRLFFSTACLLPDGKFSPAERFWQGLCAALMTAGEEAIKLGVPFELERMKNFLVQEYRRNQAVVLELNLDSAGGIAIDVEGTLSHFINSNDHVTVATDIWQNSRGGKGVATINTLKGMVKGTRDRCAIQFVRQDRLLRINRKYLSDWCVANKIPPNSFINGLENVFKARIERKLALAPRTDWASAQVTVIHIDITPTSPLEPFLDAYVTQAVLAEEAAAAAQANDNESITRPVPDGRPAVA